MSRMNERVRVAVVRVDGRLLQVRIRYGGEERRFWVQVTGPRVRLLRRIEELMVEVREGTFLDLSGHWVSGVEFRDIIQAQNFYDWANRFVRRKRDEDRLYRYKATAR